MRVFDRLLISTLFVLMMWTLVWVKSAKAEEQQFVEQNLPMFCGKTDTLLEGLKQRYSEEIVFMAPSKNYKDDDLFHSLWINAGTSTWSFIVVNKQAGMTCVIASGDGMKMFFPGDQT